MKKIIKLVIMFLTTFLLIFSLASCSSNQDENTNDPNEVEKKDDDDVKNDDSVEKYIYIHYYRFDHDYSTWALWLWPNGGDGDEYLFESEEDSYGAVCKISLSTWSGIENSKLGIIIKSKGSWSEKDVDSDRYIVFKDLTIDEDNVYHVYFKTGDETIYLDKSEVIMKDIQTCEFSSGETITFTTTDEISNYKIYENDIQLTSVDITDSTKEFFCDVESPDPSKAYKVEVTFTDSATSTKSVSMSSLFKSDYFTEKYTYTGSDLGATYTSEKTTFKVWSPQSTKMVLKIYDTGTPLSVSIETGSDTPTHTVNMTKGDYGVWEATIKEDLEGKYYTYTVTNSTYSGIEVVDPYAKSAGINGLRGMIVDFSKTNPDGWDNVSPYQYKTTELVIYETHISDITSSSTWSSDSSLKSSAKKFNGAYLSGTTYTENGISVSTGFDHIKELGVNAVQLLPIFDQDNDETSMTFNWGYNPLNYNVLEGSYSSDPYDGYTRIIEFKKLVQAYNEAGINIIMDVVYNHVSQAVGSNFDVLAPGYYFRYSNGSLSNGSGCGNETASEMPMFRKFMIDSTEFLASEYKLGGFRFDLMAVHDLETMNEVTENLRTNVNSSISIFGEPWTGGTSALSSNLSASQANGNKYEGYGQFNDQYRDVLIKGGMCATSEIGYANALIKKSITSNNITSIVAGIKGFTVGSSSSGIYDPLKTLNYATCHDNYTLYDRLKAARPTADDDTIKIQAMLANSMVLTSQGTTFILAGEEFLRTKGGDSNSYQSSYSVNELDYSLKIKYYDMFTNYQKLIKLKTTVDGLQYTTKDECNTLEITVSDNYNQISYKITDTKNNIEYYIIHNNGINAELPTIDLSGYTLYLDTLNSGITLSSSTSFSKYQTIIAYKSLS